jgi:hypothetical protein
MRERQDVVDAGNRAAYGRGLSPRTAPGTLLEVRPALA